MIRYLTLNEISQLYQELMNRFGGIQGVRDQASLESCMVQPQQYVFGTECYPSLHEKAAALCYFLVKNHPFLDGNKRIGYVAMEAFLLLNGHEMVVNVDDAERVILSLASSSMEQSEFFEWVQLHIQPTPPISHASHPSPDL
jgi:death-on-curing protein